MKVPIVGRPILPILVEAAVLEGGVEVRFRDEDPASEQEEVPLTAALEEALLEGLEWQEETLLALAVASMDGEVD